MASISIEKLVFLGCPGLEVIVVTGTAEGCAHVDVCIKLPDGENVTNDRQSEPGDRAYCDAHEKDTFGAKKMNEKQKFWVAWFDLSLYDDLKRVASRMHSEIGDASITVHVKCPETGEKSCARTYVKSDAHYSEAFDVGVLLVHGIGGAKRGETIVRFAEPIVDFMRDWLRKQSDRYAADSDSGLAEWKRQFKDLPSKPEDQLWGLAYDVFASKKISTVANFDADDTLLDPDKTQATLPAAVAIKFSVFKPDGKYQRTSILMAESCWTNTVIAPSLRELRNWIRGVTPMILSSYLVMPIGRARRRLEEVKKNGQGPSLALFWAYLLAWISVLRSWLVLIPIGLTLCGLAQILLLALTTIASLPSRLVRTAVAGIIQLLMGTTGLSYVYLNSRIRRVAIWRQVLQDLTWLRTRCTKIVILAHSQGAAVANDVLAYNIPPHAVRKLITFGSGLKKLSMLDPERVDSKKVNYIIFAWWFIMLAWFSILAWFSPFVPAMIHNILLIGLCFIAIWVFVVFNSEPPFVWASRKAVAHSFYYASHDPVPGGPILSAKDAKDTAEYIEIQNRASSFFDHTSYFENQEQFVAPVAFEIIRHSRIQLHDIFSKDFQQPDATPDWLMEAGKRRRELVEKKARTKAIFTAVLLGAFALLALSYGQHFVDTVLPPLRAPGSHTAMGWMATVTGVVEAIWVDFGPIFIILGWELWEAGLIFKWRLKENADLLLKCDSNSHLNKYYRWRLLGLIAAIVLLISWGYGGRGQAVLSTVVTLVSSHWPEGLAVLTLILVLNTWLAQLIFYQGDSVKA